MADPNPPNAGFSDTFQTKILKLYGEEGNTWLKTLPELRQSLRERWALQNAQPLSQLSYNYLEYAHSHQYGPVVLKIGFPNPELNSEIQALRVYRGQNGIVQLLDYDLERGALLLEQVIPGQDLTSISNDEEATRIAASSMLALRRPAPDSGDFPILKDWCLAFFRYQQAFPGETGPLPTRLVNLAAGTARELIDHTKEDYLLHGDLHHGNLLAKADGTWIVIDPKGVIGDFGAEFGPYLFNPIPDLTLDPDLDSLLDRRLGVFQEMTGLERDYLAAWGLVRTVLAAIWTVEESGDDIHFFLSIAMILDRILNRG